jgi:hypothetical protein
VRTLNNREFEFFFHLIEEISRSSYALGYEEAKAGKPLKTQGFSPNRASRLTIKTELKKYAEKR